jgi:hypothetical protein
LSFKRKHFDGVILLRSFLVCLFLYFFLKNKIIFIVKKKNKIIFVKKKERTFKREKQLVVLNSRSY